MHVELKHTNLYTATCFFQVYTGPQQHKAISDGDLSSINIDDLVAVYCENYSREPAIGCCTQIFEDNIEIKWMEGSYSSVWRPWKIRDQDNRRKVIIDWTDTIPKTFVWIYTDCHKPTSETNCHTPKRAIQQDQ